MSAPHGPRAIRLGALAASFILNAAFLAAMAVGLHIVPPPPEARAVVLALLPPVIRPGPKTPRQASAAQTAPPLKVLVRPPDATPGVPTAPTPVPASPPSDQKGPAEAQGDGVQAVLKETVGCDDPNRFRLTQVQRAVCDERLVAHAQGHAYGLNLADAKRQAYDRAADCNDRTYARGVPALHGATPGSSVAGLGDVPRLRDCGAGER